MLIAGQFLQYLVLRQHEISFMNVNGLRSMLNYHRWCHESKDARLKAMIDSFDCDIFCIQETKTTRQYLSTDIATVDGYYSFHCMCQIKHGYSGVSTFIKQDCKLPAIGVQDGFTGLLPNTHSYDVFSFVFIMFIIHFLSPTLQYQLTQKHK